MKMVAVIGRRARLGLSLAFAMGLPTLGFPTLGFATPPSVAGAADSRGPSTSSTGESTVANATFPDAFSGVRDGKTTTKAEVVMLLGTNDGSGIDSKIEKMPASLKAALKKPPLSAYNSYKLVDRFEPQLEKGTAQTHALPESGKLSLTLKDIVKPKDGNGKPKYVLTMSIEGRTVNLPSLEVNASEDDYFFVVAGQKFQGGALVIGLRILP